MKIWVKVGVLPSTKVQIEDAAPDMDDLRTVVKMAFKNTFMSTDRAAIVIRDPEGTLIIGDKAVTSTTCASCKRPFIIDAPQGILQNTYPYLYSITFYRLCATCHCSEYFNGLFAGSGNSPVTEPSMR